MAKNILIISFLITFLYALFIFISKDEKTVLALFYESRKTLPTEVEKLIERILSAQVQGLETSRGESSVLMEIGS